MSAFLGDYVERFNEGVRGGDFSRLLELYEDDGVLAFENVPVGPFAGREAIAEAYRAQPPDDEIALLEAREQGGVIEVRFAWSRGGTGTMRLECGHERIRRLTVAFDEPA